MKILFKSIKFINQILPKKEKSRAYLISILLFINSGLELIGLGAILPLFVILLENDVIGNYQWAAWLFNTFNLTNEKQLIVFLSLGFFIVIVLKNILSLGISKIQSVFCFTLFKKFTLQLHQIYYKKGFSFFKNTNSNIIVRDIATATERFSQAIILGSITFMNEVIVLVLIIIGIAFYNIEILILLIISVAPTFIIFYRWVRKRSIELGEIKNKVTPIMGKNIFQSIFGYTDVIVAGVEQKFRNKIENNLDKVVQVNIKTFIYNLAPTKVIECSLMLAVTTIVSFGIYLLPSKTDLIKILGLFVLAGYRIMPSINRIMISLNGLNQNIWVFSILEPLLNINKTNIVTKKFEFKKKLELKSIDFRYPDSNNNVLTNFSIKINKGEVVGLIGASGSGKTTVMNLLLAFLKPTKGVYQIDQTILSEPYYEDFYKKIGYVQQQVYLLDTTIAQNIAFGYDLKDINFKKIESVLKQTSLWDLVNSLEKGVNTIIGENGTKLSGGQRQRIGIARALYSDIEILFLDEATSSLDDKTELEITEAINNLSDGNLTIIIIAHRLSTLKGCDRVIEI